MFTKRQNALLFVCGMVEYIRRVTYNTYIDVVTYLGKEEIKYLYDFADVLHCENPYKVRDEEIQQCNIRTGNAFVDTRVHEYVVAETYMYLIDTLCRKHKMYVVDAIMFVYSNDAITAKISDYGTEYYKLNRNKIYADFCDLCNLNK